MPTNTMKAIRLHEFGGPEVLRYDEVPVPELRPGQVPILLGVLRAFAIAS